MSDRVNQVRTFEVLTAMPSRRSPRHWSDDEQTRLVAEAFSPGGTVAEAARAYLFASWTGASSGARALAAGSTLCRMSPIS
jgi:hypothetical protein